MLKILVVLGKNWENHTQSDERAVTLSIDSQISALAAGWKFVKEKFDYLIFSTGKTAGEDWPSEAQAMKDFLLKNLPKEKYFLPEEKIILEEISFDTAGNAEEVGKIFVDRDWSNQEITLMTVGYHLPRARKLFFNFGAAFTYEANSYEEMAKMGCVYASLANKRKFSFGVKLEKIKEAFLLFFLIFDYHGKMIRKLAKKVRHQK